jgi:hypothetical protein
MTDELDNYRHISTSILDLQKQLSTLKDGLIHSYDDENFTVTAIAQIKTEIKHQQSLLEKISKTLEFK